jgi:hypothetical protein
MLAAINEFEKGIMLERQREGIEVMSQSFLKSGTMHGF